MYQPRILSRAESLLRDPATGASNLAAAADTWHVFAPRTPDERHEVTGLALTVAGEGLLGHIESLGGDDGTLEIAVDVFDGYAGLRDITALTPVEIREGFQWRSGTHNGTQAFLEAGVLADGSDRVGLKGLPRLLAGGSPGQATWESDPIELRYGTSVAGLSWDAALLRDESAGTVAPPTIEIRTGTAGPGGVAWSPRVTAASTAAEAEAGEADVASGLDGDVAQLRITLPYINVPAATGPSDQVRRTATIFAVCLWVRLSQPRWSFASLAELIDRSEIGRHLGAGGWNGEDAALLRIPFSTTLTGLRGERLRARYRGGSPGAASAAGAAGAAALSVLEIQAVADLRFDLTKT